MTGLKAMTGGVAALILSSMGGAALLPALPSSAAAGSPYIPVSSSTDWASFHGNTALTGAVADPAITSSNAATMGVGWTANLFGPSLSSPIVAFSSTLGEALVYAGNQDGTVNAFNAATGAPVWSDALNSPIQSTPLAFNGSLYVGTAQNPTLFRLNAATGAIECQLALPGIQDASITEGTPIGGVPTIYVPLLDNGVQSPPTVAMNAATCAVMWSVDPYPTASNPTGSWSPASFGTDAHGVSMVFFGSSDPDSSIYAQNASTGALVWRVHSTNPIGNDFGAGPVVTAPGVNGFADGVVYVVGRDSWLYAIDMSTGAIIWKFNYESYTGTSSGSRSTCAIVGDNVVFGTMNGVVDVNAVTGVPIWSTNTTIGVLPEVFSPPVIIGPPGQEVVAFADLSGKYHIVSLATGAQLWSSNIGGYITSSSAEDAGNLYITSSDGMIYDLVPGGSPFSSGTTTITSPIDSSTNAYPASASLPIMGSSSETSGVASVDVAIQLGGSLGDWWNALTSNWQSGPIYNAATLTTPNAPTSSWSLAVPIPSEGALLTVTTRVTGVDDQMSLGHSSVEFTVTSKTSGAHIALNLTSQSPGRAVNIRGGGFLKGESINIALSGTPIATVTASATGALPSTRITIPATTPLTGLDEIVATGLSSGRVAQTEINVADAWIEAGDTTSHTSYEQGDTLLTNNVSPGQKYTMPQAWQYLTPGVPSGAPVFADRTLFFGDATGEIYALDVNAAAAKWAVSLDSAIAGSPALLGSDLIVTTTGGYVYGLAASSGAVLWKDAIGTTDVSPTIGTSAVFVANAAGTVTALNPTTGATEWSAVTSTPIAQSPVDDTATNRLLVVGTGGNATLLDDLTGAPVWNTTLSASASASPTVVATNFLLPLSNATVVSLVASTGAIAWTSATSGIPTDLAVAGAYAYFGTSTGMMQSIVVATGASRWSVAIRATPSISGVAMGPGVVVFGGANGTVGSVRTSGTEIWQTQLANQLVGSPIISNNTVYVGSGLNEEVAFTPFGEAPF